MLITLGSGYISDISDSGFLVFMVVSVKDLMP